MIHHPVTPTERKAPHIAAAQTSRQRDAASTRDGLRRNYGMIAFRPELIGAMRRYFAELAEGRYLDVAPYTDLARLMHTHKPD